MSHGLLILWMLFATWLPKNAVLGDAIQNSTTSATITRYPSPYLSTKPTEKALLGYPTTYITKPPLPELRNTSISPILTPRPSGFTSQLFGDKPVTGSFSGQTNTNEKLTQERLEKCQKVEAKIKTEASTGITNITNAYASISGVLVGVNTYYKDKLVPAGIVVTSYDSSLSNIQNKQKAFLTNLQIAKTDLATFSCTATAPGKQISTFKQDIKQLVQSVKDIKASIKELVLAIKNAAQTFNEDATTASGSAK